MTKITGNQLAPSDLSAKTLVDEKKVSNSDMPTATVATHQFSGIRKSLYGMINDLNKSKIDRPSIREIVTIGAEDLDMSKAASVISAAQKFILPIPDLKDGGVPLLDSNKKPITDWQGNPIGESGVIFFNGTDKTAQGVQGDGTGVIIFNDVTEEQASMMKTKVNSLASTPSQLSYENIVDILDTATANGMKDRYNSSRNFIEKSMTPVGGLGTECFGLYKRDDKDICSAVLVKVLGKGTAKFKGPAASPQVFEDSAVIVQHGKERRLVQAKEFAETYRMADNTPVDVEKLPVGWQG